MALQVPSNLWSSGAFDDLLEGIQVLDRDWNYQYVNVAAVAHNHRPASELLGKNYVQCWPGIENTAVYPVLKSVMDTRVAAEVENPFTYPDGSSGNFSLRIRPIPEGVLILSVEITERRRAEKQLAHTTRLYHLLSQVNQAIVRVREPQALYEAICEVTREFGGFDAAWIGLLNDKTGDLVPVAASGVSLAPWPFPRVNVSSGPLQGAFAASSQGPDAVLIVEDLVATAEQDQWSEFRGVPYRGAAFLPLRMGNVTSGVLTILSQKIGILGSPDDRRLLEELAGDLTFALTAMDSERLLRQWADAFKHCAHGIMLGDPVTDTIITCNAAYANAQRSTPEALAGTPIRGSYPPEQRAQLTEYLRQSDETGSVRFEAVKTRTDGTTYEAEMDVVSVRDPSGRLLYRVASVKDTSERNRLQAQLLQAQKLESLGNLSSGIAHDFNNLLAVILGNTQLLRQNPADPMAVMRRLEAIVTATMRGADLVRQLLTFARKTPVNFKQLDVNTNVAEAASLLTETFPRSIELVMDFADGLPFIEADPTQIHQVIFNLGVNAKDAMPEGGRLTLATRLDNHDGTPYVVLSVKDTGSGMDDPTLHRIFEPFFTTKPEGKGTGLGLATVFGILKGHGGWVEVVSALGSGSEFQCWFPAAVSKGADQASLPVESLTGGTGMILVVEDEEPLRCLVDEQLTLHGYKVLTAVDGIDGDRQFRAHRADICLVLSDLDLPGRRGDELFRSLKAQDPSVKFVLASGYYEPGLQERLLSEGVSGFLQKPFNEASVLSVVEKARRSP
jgi:PAS domain S-box-containing protein